MCDHTFRNVLCQYASHSSDKSRLHTALIKFIKVTSCFKHGTINAIQDEHTCMGLIK